MKKYPCYLFDLDGTLIDTIDLVYECFRYTVENIKNQQMERNDVIPYIGIPLKAQYRHFFPLENDETLESYMKFHMDYQFQIYPKFLRAFPLAKETLQSIKESDAKIALVTSRRKMSATTFTKETGLYEYFDALITPEDTDQHKPDPAPARLALSQLGFKPQESLFVGDAEFDMDCGQATGTDTAFCLWGTNDVSKLKIKPTYCLSSLTDLIK